jgi:hypothetical protein
MEFGRAVVVLAFGTAALAVVCAVPVAAKPARSPLAKKHREQRQRALSRALRRDPRVATQPSFLRKAALFGVDVPITVRLNTPLDQAGTPSPSDDQIKIAFDPAPADPALPNGVTPTVVSSTVSGGWNGTLKFSADTSGYGSDGVIELGFRKVAMEGTGFNLIEAADPTPCVGGAALLATSPVVDINTGLRSQGYVDIFKDTFDIALHTQFAFASARRDDCTSNVFETTSVMTGELRPPLPIRLTGVFRVSPAVTPDGQVRLGKLTLRGVQSDSHVEVHTCTDAPPAIPACPPESTLTGRLVASTFTADLLIGTLPL